MPSASLRVRGSTELSVLRLLWTESIENGDVGGWHELVELGAVCRACRGHKRKLDDFKLPLMCLTTAQPPLRTVFIAGMLLSSQVIGSITAVCPAIINICLGNCL